MEIHSVGTKIIEDQIQKLKEQHVTKKGQDPFVDPIKEFSRASQKESMVRHWLTYPLEERKRLVRDSMRFVPRFKGDEREGRLPESEKDFDNRQLERWRTLNGIIQEESRAKPPVRSVEVAIGALKQLFYDADLDGEAKKEKIRAHDVESGLRQALGDGEKREHRLEKEKDEAEKQLRETRSANENEVRKLKARIAELEQKK